jgi:hypothetical protein
MAQFERPHHQKIALILHALNGPLLRNNHCLFAGGTVMAMRYGEYRESVDIDFLVSDVASYRRLRELLTGSQGVAALARDGMAPLLKCKEIRADQYGIRTALYLADQAIKFEIVLEGRIQLDLPGAEDEICGIATLTPLDMATCKLLANSDRWNDDGVFSRDIIDLAMMKPSLVLLRQAIEKAETAYGAAIRHDLSKAIQQLKQRPDRLERCMNAMEITLPKAVLWSNLRALRRVL